jgi:hypothetical protein
VQIKQIPTNFNCTTITNTMLFSFHIHILHVFTEGMIDQ